MRDRRLVERLWDGFSVLQMLPLMGAVVCLAVGYSLFMAFINREGRRRLRAQTEIALAREIHVSLVPPVALETAWCEVHGRSIPA